MKYASAFFDLKDSPANLFAQARYTRRLPAGSKILVLLIILLEP